MKAMRIVMLSLSMALVAGTFTGCPFLNPNLGVEWEQISASVSWAPRSGHAVVVFDNRLWVLGGADDSGARNDVWYSDDGVTWTEATAAAGWEARYDHTATVFDGKIWVMGGTRGLSLDGDWVMNDVWYSEDGVLWTKVLDDAPWTPRFGHKAAVLERKLWLAGGMEMDGLTMASVNDVWSTEDGQVWTRMTGGASWTGRLGHGLEVFDNQLWVVAGGQGSYGLLGTFAVESLGDIWQSADGVTWTAVTSQAPFPDRWDFGSVAADGRLWVLGGEEAPESGEAAALGDVWYSEDGVTWTSSVTQAPWAARYGHGATYFKGRLWVMGGEDKDGYVTDVWASPPEN